MCDILLRAGWAAVVGAVARAVFRARGVPDLRPRLHRGWPSSCFTRPDITDSAGLNWGIANTPGGGSGSSLGRMSSLARKSIVPTGERPVKASSSTIHTDHSVWPLIEAFR